MVEIEYEDLRKKWGKSGQEIKGRELNETQAADVIALLAKYQLFVDVSAIDMGVHPDDAVSAFKEHQARLLVANLTPDHNINLVEEMHKIAHDLRKISNQLFVQYYPQISLLSRILQTGTMYYAQRRPTEIGDFSWIVDAKNTKITPAEELFRILLPAFVINRTAGFLSIAEADYSYFRKYETEVDADYLRSTHVEVESPGPHIGYDTRKVFVDNMVYLDSRSSIGLQLADHVAAIYQRAMNGTLQEPGWRELGRLFINLESIGRNTIQLLVLDTEARHHDRSQNALTARQQYQRVHNRILHLARPMFDPSFMKKHHR